MTTVGTRTFPCASCGATLVFDAASQGLACPHCGARTAIGTPAAPPVERDLESALAAGEGRPAEPGVRLLRCSGCGAELRLSQGLESIPCPFCGAPQVAEDMPGDKVLPPEGVAPFRVAVAAARDGFRQWLRRRWFAPSELKHGVEREMLKGVYVPFWTYDADADSSWTAMSGTYYYTTQTYRGADGRIRTRQVRHVRWSPSAGNHSGRYDDVPVCASRGLEGPLLEAIEPFDLSALVSYEPRLLAGWHAEAASIDLRDGWKAATGRIQDAERSECARQVPGDTYTDLDVQTQLSHLTFKHILLPVWVAAYGYHGRTYRFLVNGQTGEVRGEAPLSPWKAAGAVAAVLAALLAALWAASQ